MNVQGASKRGRISRAAREEAARNEVMAAGDDETTLRPPASSRGEIGLLSGDVDLLLTATRLLAEAGFSLSAAVDLVTLPVALPHDVLVLDPGEDRPQTVTILEVLARVRSRPATVIVIRSVEDLEIATRFRVGAVAIDAVEEQLVEAVERARRDRRMPRLPHA